ncbi:hypothetical protein FHS26_001588 [Rhizobium pisi]|nr:hypothetical protein [Rhizobium pisi]MBB3133875.1 hypothetical protein [Rhizobium pisi]
MSDLLARARRQVSGRVGNVTLNLPFVSFDVSPKDKEKQVAREIVIRLKDRRVLSAWECCDNCIDHALASLQEIRRTLVDKQVDLSDLQDGPLFLLLDAMSLGIRQFLTFEQRLKAAGKEQDSLGDQEFYRPPDTRQAYFDGLEVLRGHLSRCLGQVAAIGGMELPADGLISNYRGAWQIEAYNPPHVEALDHEA